MNAHDRNNHQSLKGAVGATLCQNEAEVSFPMERVIMDINGNLLSLCGNLISPACSVDEIWWKFPLEMILLPHSGRGSRQLLLSIPERSEWRHKPNASHCDLRALYYDITDVISMKIVAVLSAKQVSSYVWHHRPCLLGKLQDFSWNYFVGWLPGAQAGAALWLFTNCSNF